MKLMAPSMMKHGFALLLELCFVFQIMIFMTTHSLASLLLLWRFILFISYLSSFDPSQHDACGLRPLIHLVAPNSLPLPPLPSFDLDWGRLLSFPSRSESLPTFCFVVFDPHLYPYYSYPCIVLDILFLCINKSLILNVLEASQVPVDLTCLPHGLVISMSRIHLRNTTRYSTKSYTWVTSHTRSFLQYWVHAITWSTRSTAKLEISRRLHE